MIKKLETETFGISFAVSPQKMVGSCVSKPLNLKKSAHTHFDCHNNIFLQGHKR